MLQGMKRVSLVGLWFVAQIAFGQSLTGRWDAVIKNNGTEIPFRFEIQEQSSGVTGSFFNGDEAFASTSGRFDETSLVLNWDYYAAKLEAKYQDGVLQGTYVRSSRQRGGPVSFVARRHVPKGAAAVGPSISGTWEIPAKSSKGESTWRLIVQQSSADVSAGILRVDGDTGAYTGSFRDGKFVLSHFDGLRSGLMEITPLSDGTLRVTEANNTLTAVRPLEAREKNLPAPTDPNLHTRVKDPQAGFPFRFPDLSGKTVSNEDSRFKSKVLLVNISGSWCPNCHDEAPFLAQLYKKYRALGLEIVTLSFEEEDQLKDPVRLRSFVKKYGIEYPVLLGGEPSEASSKLSQAENWNTWPATFFLDRHGKVRFIHAGFPSSASGELHTQAKQEFVTKVEQLLAE
jgi:thiol-disulfide isomerase/thioredoxin